VKKHYVLLEFIPDMDIGVSDIPWSAILEGAVIVTNYKNITKQSLNELENIAGVGQVFANTDGYTAEEVIELLNHEPVELPDDIYVWQPHEYVDEDHLLELVEEAGSGAVSEMCSYLQIDRYEMAD
jgi:hypothetical protein